jgi:ectoine hydroxylase-related dioxygenase (phytanoyl-CoA dioxygenase family)
MATVNQPPAKTYPIPHADAAPQSLYHLTAEQIQFFDDNGYLILRKWIPEPLLSRLQDAGKHWIEMGHAPENTDPDFAFKNLPAGKTMFRVDFIHNKKQRASLEFLGSPQVLGLAESLCGPNFVPTYEAMVFKQEGNGAAIEWHQDAVHPRKFRIFNLGLYLEHSKIGAGALHVVPGSNTCKQDVCQIAEEYGWSPPGMIHVEMEPGDILLHDVMVVHGSEETQGNALRRTVYLEFRPAEEILEDGPWDRKWIDTRMRLIPLALRRHQETFPSSDQYQWNVSSEFRPQVSNDEETELRIVHKVHLPGSYCSAGDAKKKSDISKVT